MTTDGNERPNTGTRSSRWRYRIIPEFVRRRYLLKFVTVLLVMGIAVGAMGLVGTMWLTDQMEQSVLEDQATLASAESSNLEGWFERHDDQVNLIASDTTVRSGDTDRIQTEVFDGLHDQIPLDVVEIHYVDKRDGEIKASTTDQRRGDSLSSLGIPDAEEFIVRATQRISARSKPYLLETDVQEIPVVTYAREVRTQEDRLILYTIPLEPVSDELQTSGDEDITTLVVDTNQRVVLDDRVFGGEELTFGSPFLHADELPSFHHLIYPTASRVGSPPVDEDIADVYGFTDQEYLVGYSRVGGSGWTLLIYTSTEQSMGFVQTVQMLGAVATLFAIIVITVLGTLLARSTTRSINRLSRRAQSVTAGDFDVDLETSRNDEIGELYDAFASMRDAIRQRIDELEDARLTEEQMRRELEDSKAEIEQQRLIISVLNRMLRHNLRNSLTKVLLYLGRQETDEEHPIDDPHARIESEIEQLLRQAEKTRAIESVFRTNPDQLPVVHLADEIQETVDIFVDTYPNATIETNFEDDASVRGGDGVSFIVDNLIENALEHNDRATPHVRVSVDTISIDGEPRVELTIADDGPGIPDAEITVLSEEKETPLTHGSGLGLWLVNWLVDHLGGEISFADRDPRGTVVTVRFPPVASNSE